jgi:hypothetical protein
LLIGYLADQQIRQIIQDKFVAVDVSVLCGYPVPHGRKDFAKVGRLQKIRMPKRHDALARRKRIGRSRDRRNFIDDEARRRLVDKAMSIAVEPNAQARLGLQAEKGL